jgi:hypothetical protein
MQLTNECPEVEVKLDHGDKALLDDSSRLVSSRCYNGNYCVQGWVHMDKGDDSASWMMMAAA